MAETRYESDTMGRVEIEARAYWGAQTQRALENFGVSERRIPPVLIHALGMIKAAAAEVNRDLGLLDAESAGAILQAAEEVAAGRFDDQFPVDVFQTGSGTSWNMNANEVIANRANEILGRPLGSKEPVHPNDQVNRCQSSNDVIPTAIQIANRISAAALIAALEELKQALEERAAEFAGIIKIGRTHLQDAVPMTLGQAFSGYAAQIAKASLRIGRCLESLEELSLGATAIGTGINSDPAFGPRVIARIAERSGFPFRRAENLFEATSARDAQAELMGSLSTAAGSLRKIADDLRLLSSGPRAGLGEIILPALQPGSSIMPGKVNPVIPEMVIQAAVYVQGKAVTVSAAAGSAPLELNIMMPLIAQETQESLELLTRVCRAFAERCISGIRADEERCAHWVEWSLALITPLAARIGYDRAADLAYRAFREKKTVRSVLEESKLLPPDEIDALLDPRGMTGADFGGKAEQ
jgi:fumarate hydratase class II